MNGCKTERTKIYVIRRCRCRLGIMKFNVHSILCIALEDKFILKITKLKASLIIESRKCYKQRFYDYMDALMNCNFMIEYSRVSGFR